MRRIAALACGRPRMVLIATGALLLAALALGLPLVGSLQTSLSDFEDPSSQTARASALIQRATGAQDELGMLVLLPTPTGARSRTAASAQMRVVGLLSTQRGFRDAIDYANSGDRELVSRDGRQALVLATFATRAEAYAAAGRLTARLRPQGAAFGGLDIVFEELTHRSRSDLERAELLVLPLLAALSLWVFGGVVAALLPLLVGGLAVLGTLLCMRAVGEGVTLSVFALNLVSALGLGLAIDYSLFVLSRYREELASVGAARPDRWERESLRRAIERTLQTAGRTVLFSCLTVAAAMASLMVFPLRFLYSMGIAGVLTALLAGAVSLIVLPAALLLLGQRIDALTPAWLRRSRARASRPQTSGFWATLARGVMRRPGAVALVSAGVLLAAGAPALSLGLTPASSSLLPASSAARQVDEQVRRGFGGNPALPIADVVQAEPGQFPRVEAYAQRVAAANGQARGVHLLYLGHSTWLIAVAPRGDPFGVANERLVRRLRALRAPFPGAVGGITAWFTDELTSLRSHLPVAFLIVALTMFAMIFAMTGSVVLPVKTLLLNLLTLSATTGVLVLAFQGGGLGGVLDFRGNGGLEPSNLVLLFTVAFALTSDYGVFLLARIKEGHDAGMSNRDAVAIGLERTGRLVTAAALLFCVAVGALVSSGVLSIKELGFGAALAVFIDASVVRALLVPALMALLGRWNWWAPQPLRRLHERIGLREGPALKAHPPHAAAAAASSATTTGPATGTARERRRPSD